MDHRKPLIIDPSLCAAIAADSEQVCSTCERKARWLAPPTVEELLKQVTAEQVDLAPFCSVCTLYRSTLFKGMAARLKNFISEVEAAGKKVFLKENGQVVEEQDAVGVVAAVWFTSYRGLRTQQFAARLRGPR